MSALPVGRALDRDECGVLLTLYLQGHSLATPKRGPRSDGPNEALVAVVRKPLFHLPPEERFRGEAALTGGAPIRVLLGQGCVVCGEDAPNSLSIFIPDDSPG